MPPEPFVYFDLGMVLVTFEHRIATEQLAALTGKPTELVEQVVFDSGLQNEYETGLVTSEEFVARVRTALDSSAKTAEILEAISAIFAFNEAIIPVLEFLRGKGIPMAILSNTCEAHWQWIVKQGWQVPGDWFEHHVLSYEVQSMKPDAKIYEFCEEQSGRDPSQLFFTDDRLENTDAAKRRGWRIHTFTEAQLLLAELQTWLKE